MKNYYILLFFIIALNSVKAQKFEAEKGTLTGVIVQTARSGYLGTGYVGNFENNNDQLSLNFNISEGGYYNLYIGYSCPYGEKINILVINGNSFEITFPSSATFTEVSAGKVKLNSGNNTFTIKKSWGWFLVDYFRIEPNTDPVTQFNISTQLVTPNASDEAKRLFSYLVSTFGTRVHSGAMSLNAKEEADWIHSQTGKYPALIGMDFMNHTCEYNWYDKSILVKETVAWYRKNGMVALMWHWRDPLRNSDEFYTSQTDFDVRQITNTSSSEYAAIISDIDIIAEYLKELNDSGVPVLFRPLHEASGGWFWWGAHGAEPLKALWKLMFDRLVNYHGINNLIWIWTTDAKSDNLNWYPGDDYVDILGMDIYAPTGDYGSQIINFDKIKEDFRGKKLITLSENGNIPDPDKLVSDGAGWSWFMPWYGNYIRADSINSVSYWQKVMNHEYVITLDEMPDLKIFSNTLMEKTNEDLKLYFTQNRNYLYISVNNLKMFDAEIIDINGRTILTKKNMIGSISIPVPDNIYFIIKVTCNSRTWVYKIIK